VRVAKAAIKDGHALIRAVSQHFSLRVLRARRPYGLAAASRGPGEQRVDFLDLEPTSRRAQNSARGTSLASRQNNQQRDVRVSD
jgi:hypothetical protein